MPRRIEPYRIKAVEPIPLTTRGEREDALMEADWNLFRLPASRVTVDLLTDSGVCAMSAHQWAAMMEADESYAGARSFEHLQSSVRRLTGMTHVIPAHQGRAAERLLLEALVKPGDVVPGNMHFDTTRANIERLGGIAVDLPVDAALSPSLEAPFKGNLDVSALDGLLARLGGARPPLVIVTITSNGCGGQPVSMENVRHVRAACDAHGIPLFLDAARFAENAWLVREREDGWRDTPPRAIARAMFALADGVMMSGKKDALVNIGGFIALRDRAVAE
ncbi:MAG TPA: tryptophanase, partial [Vicinamibacteria bacterium]|nr:tryptophanase [Vicinamibacteria bacterium]